MNEPIEEDSYAPLMKTINDHAKSKASQASWKIISAAIAIVNISVGSVFFHDCPAQFLIPYYLIISGISSILLIVLFSLPCEDDRDPPEKPVALRTVIELLLIFQLAFFITGNIWIYSIHAPNWIDPNDQNYCHKWLYLYAFWITTLFYIFLGVTLVLFFCFLIYFCIKLAKNPSS